MDEIARAFVAEARRHLLADYLPKIERCLERLNDEQAWWRAGEQSNSVGNLLLHLEGNARQWLVSGVGGAPDRRARDREFEERAHVPVATLLADLRATLAEADAALARLGPEALLERRHIQGHDVTVLAAVFHVVEHFSMHTGQIILLTKLLTGRDLAFYDFSGGKPRPRWQKAVDGRQ
ncbi:MAG TPA: DinB family protein [Pyrinomonadaceae bacterium]|nr:DinB family protein [Pyrinomonadaceae bacterium]